jgi:hypothetical protein
LVLNNNTIALPYSEVKERTNTKKKKINKKQKQRNTCAKQNKTKQKT